MFLLEGLAGSFFRPLALSYVLAILASLLVALIVTPALSLLLLPQAHARARGARRHAPARTRYRRLLPRSDCRAQACRSPIVAISLAVTAAAFPFLGEEFLPNFQEYDFLMHWVEKPGTSLEAMRRVTVQRQPGADGRGGRAQLRRAHRPRGGRRRSRRASTSPSSGSVSIHRSTTRRKVAEIQGVVDGYPGLTRDLLTYLRERIKEVLTGASATIVVRIFGPNLDATGGDGR